MNFFFAFALTAFSFSTFSQSYVIMDNGLIVTTDTNGFSYDLGHYAYPQKVTQKGGQYFIEDNSILATVDENGLFFRKYELIPEKIIGKGLNYFLSSEGVLTTIDKKGEVKVSESIVFKNAMNFGGNYFTVAIDPERTIMDLYIVSEDGKVLRANLPAFKVSEIVSFGGNYFMTNRGVIATVAADGRVFMNDQVRVGLIVKKGGNYFTDSSNYFYSVSQNGDLVLPGIPSGLKISKILRFGSNYFIDQQGKFFVVDKTGAVYERSMRDQDFRLAKVISL